MPEKTPSRRSEKRSGIWRGAFKALSGDKGSPTRRRVNGSCGRKTAAPHRRDSRTTKRNEVFEVSTCPTERSKVTSDYERDIALSMFTPEYHESALSADGDFARENAFTCWMSRDLMQASVDFSKNMGLVPIYAQSHENGTGRYLFWHRPPQTALQVRSHRTRDDFLKLDEKSQEIGWSLLSLHIRHEKEEIYSAVWIAPGRLEHAVQVLALYGIGQAKRIPPERGQ